MTTSIIILTLNQLAVTRQCIESIRQYTPESYELILVDNGSTDGTVDYLKSQPNLKAVFNSSNLGFAKGCNQGQELATGDNILFLNNDTVVTQNWLRNMLRLLYSRPEIGMVGPVSNNISGHQQIPVSYSELSGLADFAREYCAKNAGDCRRVFRLVGFCLLAKKEVLDQVGWFDEQYGLGNYEDDDLCLRAVQAGFQLMIASDSFVHHIGQVTFNSVHKDTFNKMMEENRKKVIAKWGFNIATYLHNLQPEAADKMYGAGPFHNSPSFEARVKAGEEIRPQDLYFFANEFLKLNQHARAIEFFEKFLALAQVAVEDKIAACGKVADIFIERGDYINMKKYIFRSFEYAPPRAEFCCRLGFAALKEQNYQDAIAWYKIATLMERPAEKCCSLNDACWTWLPHLQLAICYDRVGEKELGCRHNEFARYFAPEDTRVLYNRNYFAEILGTVRTAEIEGQVKDELARRRLLGI